MRGRVFALLDRREFETRFRGWATELAGLARKEVVAIDGKLLRGSHEQSKDLAAITMVSAWTNEAHMVLGQLKVETGTKVIVTVPKLGT